MVVIIWLIINHLLEILLLLYIRLLTVQILLLVLLRCPRAAK